MTSLGSILRAARGRLELSQEEVAQRANIGVYTVSRLETGQTPHPQPTTLARLAVVLNLDPESLEVAAQQPTATGQESNDSASIHAPIADSAEKRVDMNSQDEASKSSTAGHEPQSNANSSEARREAG